MTNLDSILKSRDITLLTKICLVKAMAFPVVTYGCESWTKRKLSAKGLMLLNCGDGKTLKVPWTARRSNQSILKEIIGMNIHEYSLEGLMLKLQYFGHLMRPPLATFGHLFPTNSLEKTLMLGKTEGGRRRG